MEITLSRNACAILNVLINDPNRLLPGINPYNATAETKPVMPYKAPDTAVGLELVAISRWLENKVLLKREDGLFNVPLNGWKGNVGKKSLIRLKEIAKHYEPWGLLANNCAPYMELVYALDCKKIEDDLVDIGNDG